MKNKLLFALLAVLQYGVTSAQEIRQLSPARPDAVADLKTNRGAEILQAKWYVQPAVLKTKQFRSPGPSTTDLMKLYPTGMILTTHSIDPQVGAADFDKSFVNVKPTELENREGTGLVSFVWFKVEFTIPDAVGKLDTRGSTAVFEITVDDYSEVWVNGKQQLNFGQSGGGGISGYNTRNRVVLTNNCQPGEKFSIAILGINGPMGKIPDNYIWIRNAVVDFYKELPRNESWSDIGRIFSVDSKLDDVIVPGTKVEKIADGFSFSEGPVWHPEGFLLFSDPNTNTIYKLDPLTYNVSVYISHSGYSGENISDYHQPGSNGLAIDKDGRLIIDQHGNRRVIRIEKKGPVTVLADRIEGKRLNSPNDIVLRSDGVIYFTDPPYGLPGFYSDKEKELDYQGVFMIRNGVVSVVAKDCGGPNGIAFSPDEKYLYVGNWDIRDIHHTKTVWRYEVKPDGTLSNGKIFFDWNLTEDDEAIDGIKVDREGNLFVSAPGGIWVIDANARLLGKIVTPERPANMAWGDADGKTLYMTAHKSIYRMRVATGGKFSWQ
jgi:gluconolactonase